MSEISNLAYIHPEAKIGNNVRVEAFAYIDRDVEIGDGCLIHPHASVLAGARLGKNCTIYEGSVISAKPQDFRWNGEDSFVKIGNNVTIREHVIINRSIHARGCTSIDDNSFVCAQTHIGHDSKIGKYCVLGNAVKLAGDVEIDDCVIMSSGSLCHEGWHIGKFSLIKGGCRVNGNVPPYVIISHNPPVYDGINTFILRRAEKDEKLLDDIATCYRYIYNSKTSPDNAVRHIIRDIDETECRNEIVEFLKKHNYKIIALATDKFE